MQIIIDDLVFLLLSQIFWNVEWHSPDSRLSDKQYLSKVEGGTVHFD